MYFYEDDTDETSDEPSRLNVEWLTLVALRDSIGITLKDSSVPYKETLRLGETIAPVLYHKDRSLLRRKWESAEARECRAIANATSTPFEDVVSEQISTFESFLKASKSLEDKKVLTKRLEKLRQINQENQSKEYFEGRIIQRDASLGEDLPISKRGDGYYDFSLPARRWMRVRITHDTKVEAINGADLIYEHHLLEQMMVRISAIQYKIMKNGRYVPKSRKLKNQLDRLEKHFCDGLPCIPSSSTSHQFYRFPSCTAFLRLTSKLQSSNEKMMSIGVYAPVCQVQSLWKDDRPISLKNLEGEAVTYRVFEELFNWDLLGSRWLSYVELEKIYREQQILDAGESVAMHLQLIER
jgi:hypothetical protein